MVKENHYAIVMTDIYTKLTRFIAAEKTTTIHVANVFFESSIVL